MREPEGWRRQRESTRQISPLASAQRWRYVGRIVRVEARHFVAGLIVHEGVCVSAAPILKWAVGRRWAWLEGYLRGRGYSVMAG